MFLYLGCDSLKQLNDKKLKPNLYFLYLIKKYFQIVVIKLAYWQIFVFLVTILSKIVSLIMTFFLRKKIIYLKNIS